MSAVENVSNEEIIGKLRESKKDSGRSNKLAIVIGLLIFIVVLFVTSYTYKYFGLGIVSKETIHWHTKLFVTIDGRRIVIPPSVGLLGDIVHPSNIHTHEADNIVHMEIEGPVTASQVMLSKFFDVWGKSKEKIGKMLVNGRLNNDGYRYIMKNKDEIEIFINR
ncbi:MAG TPA: hypothetical protein VJI73_02805 [Candidatus Paceibacterota bacterium]